MVRSVVNHCSAVISLILLALCCSSASARIINITVVDNCVDPGPDKPVAYFTDIQYHIAEDGTCDQVHLALFFETIDPAPMQLFMDLYKCEEANMNEPCMANPTHHEELLDCERLMNDDSGPWHMFTSVMDKEYACGLKDGAMQLEFARLRLEHLIKYLDVYDATYNTFRLKMNFVSTATNKVRGCGEVDFVLMPL